MARMTECPSIVDANPESQDLSYKKRLELLENDAQSLYKFCISKGFSTNQMKTCLTPLLGKQKPLVTRIAAGSSRSIFKLSILIGVVAMLYGWPTSNKMVNVHVRLLNVKTIPWWDWTGLYEEDCLINNPYLPEKKLSEEDCVACKELPLQMEEGDLERLIDVNTTMVTDEFLYADWPLVVTDPVRDWPVDKDGKLLFSLKMVKELYMTNPSLVEGSELDTCEFFSTMEESKNIFDYIKALNEDTLPTKYHVAWENCQPSAAKVFRLYTKRPYFLPAMAESSKSNQIIVAKGDFEGDVFHIPQQVDSASWIAVLTGRMMIHLVPHEECNSFNCKEVSFVLSAGEAMLVSTRIWTINYSPSTNDVTLAFSSTVVWDDV